MESGGSALITRIHHVIGDANALVGLLLNAMDEAARLGNSRGALGKPISTSKLQNLKHKMSVPKFLIKSFARRNDKNPLHIDTISGTRALAKKTFDLDRVKVIKRFYQCTFNDLMMTVLAGGFRDYFLRHGMTKKKIKTTNVVVSVNMRTPNEMIHMELSNKVAVIQLALPTQLEDPVQRLHTVKHSMTRAKSSSEPMVTRFMMGLIDKMDPRTRGEMVRNSFKALTAVTSNVHGPDQAVYLKGNLVTEIGFFVPSTGSVGIGLSICTYGESIFVGLNSDTNACANPNELLTDVENSFDRLFRSAKGETN